MSFRISVSPVTEVMSAISGVSCLCMALLMFTAMTVQARQNIYLNPDAPVYMNKKYGFSFSLPSGQWNARQSRDGSEIVITDGAEGDTDCTLVKASVQTLQTQDLQKIYAEELKGYRTVIESALDRGHGEFFIRAVSTDDRLTFLRYCVRKNRATVLLIRTSADQQDTFDYTVKEVNRSFRPGSGR